MIKLHNLEVKKTFHIFFIYKTRYEFSYLKSAEDNYIVAKRNPVF